MLVPGFPLPASPLSCPFPGVLISFRSPYPFPVGTRSSSSSSTGWMDPALATVAKTTVTHITQNDVSTRFVMGSSWFDGL
jgi:hypothetical protein